jgi:acetyltransferase
MNPADFHFKTQLDDGMTVTIRPIRPDDAVIEQEFVRSLSPQSKFLRFFAPLKELSPAALKKFTQTNYPSEMALIATIIQQDVEREICVARYAPGTRDGWVEFAVAVADEWHGEGIATQLLQNLFNMAKEAGIRGIEGSILRENRQMLILAKELGFVARSNHEDTSVTYVHKDLQ